MTTNTETQPQAPTNPLDMLRFDAQGVLPAVVQHYETNEVLMMGFMNREALERTIHENKVVFWSRSRGRFWMKGESSGMYLHLKAIRVNCENNSLLVLADSVGPTCHTGHNACYYRELQGDTWAEIAPVLVAPEELYKNV